MGHIGAVQRRVEDERLVTGRGRYASDVQLEDAAHMALRRSDQPHARIVGIDPAAALAMPGVYAVYTAADLPDTARTIVDEGMPPHLIPYARPVLAAREINHTGEAVAAVIATSAGSARDAAGAVRVEMEPLPAAGNIGTAIRVGAPAVHQGADTNIAWRAVEGFGNPDDAFNSAAVIVRDRITLGRVMGAAIEPRAAVAVPEGGGVALWTSTQAVFRVRDMLAKALQIEEGRIAVRAEDVGGGFGPKGRRYPEDLLVTWAAMKLGVPVRWTATRAEETAASVHAHGSVFELEVAADEDGTLRGLRGILWHDIGAYASIGALLPGSILRHMLSTYRLPAVAIEIRDVFTNATPTGTVRGGGGPEANFAVERMLDLVADHLNVLGGEVRRRNLIRAADQPYEVSLQGGSRLLIETGDSPQLLEATGRQTGAWTHEKDGRLHGVGMAMGIEHAPRVFANEPARIRIGPEGSVEVFVGSSPQGQSHETMVTQVVADRLGWPIDRIAVTAADTTRLPKSGPTASSRSAVSVGNAVALAARSARRRLIALAASSMGVAEAELDIEDGFVVDRRGRRRAAVEFIDDCGIDITESWFAAGGTSPGSCHAVQVAVDPETGAVEVERYVVVYDAGVVINPRVVEGQLAGGVVHGIGYALREEAIYASSGALLTTGFRDYEIASPPDIRFELTLLSMPTATASNPEGFKGAGEIGTLAAPAAVASAVEAAVRQLVPGARISDLPIRPETITKLIRSGG